MLGPDAPTLCPPWTTGDMAAHLASAVVWGGVPTWYGRRLVGLGIRLNDRRSSRAIGARVMARGAAKGFEWCLERLERDPPRILSRPSIRGVSLFEVWTHHEDVRRANGMGPDPSREHPELAESLAFVAHYQRAQLGGRGLVVASPGRPELTVRAGPDPVVLRGPVGEALLWTAGRASVARVEVEATVPVTPPGIV